MNEHTAVQVSGYLNGGFVGFRRTYFTHNQAEALDEFRKEMQKYPTFDQWICVAEYIDI